MNTLRIPLEALAESAVLMVNATANEEQIRPRGVEPIGMREVRLEGTLSKIDAELYFEGTASAEITGQCDRCLGPATLRIEQPVVWYFERGEVAEIQGADGALEFSETDIEEVIGDNVRMISGDTLDLGEALWEDLVLAMPSKMLCSEDCKGICPTCGADLNAGTCNCVVEEVPAEGHPGLAKLKDMFPDLPERVEE